jgi:hypothetical protein
LWPQWRTAAVTLCVVWMCGPLSGGCRWSYEPLMFCHDGAVALRDVRELVLCDLVGLARDRLQRRRELGALAGCRLCC